MPDLLDRWTREEVLALPDDGNRYELLDGELLVSPSPTYRHQDAVLRLFRLLDPYVLSTRIGHLGLAPADLSLGGSEFVQPDLYVVPLVEGRSPRDWQEHGIPLLVVEVGSPSTAHYDRTIKRKRYQAVGVQEYWVVDLDGRLVERWRPGDLRPEVLDTVLTWQPAEEHPALEIDLTGFFNAIP